MFIEKYCILNKITLHEESIECKIIIISKLRIGIEISCLIAFIYYKCYVVINFITLLGILYIVMKHILYSRLIITKSSIYYNKKEININDITKIKLDSCSVEITIDNDKLYFNIGNKDRAQKIYTYIVNTNKHLEGELING
jgi:hypothetical protein